MSDKKVKLCWQQIPSPLVSEILADQFDGVVLDTEHGAFNEETIFTCIQVIKLKKKKCLVRITSIEKAKIRYILDAGADGIIFSTVEDKQQCEKIIEYSCYPPFGKRGLGLVRQNGWGTNKLVSDKPILVPQIETKRAIDNLKVISSFNFDFYMIGPYDLSMSLGCIGNFKDEKFALNVSKFNDTISIDKRAIHIPDDVKNKIVGYEEYGLLCLGMDTIALIEYHKEMRGD
mgnify:CR=1 FL=1